MAEVEEPQYTTLQERIAALNQSQSKQHQTFGKRPPPPIPTSSNRPAAPARTQTANIPPIATNGSAVTKQPSNLPGVVNRINVLPPPPIDRDNPRLAAARTPPVPSRNLPPPFLGRGASEVSPALPPRNAAASLDRKGSNSSISSSVSGMSLNQTRTGSSMTSTTSVDAPRKLLPTFDAAKLSILPASQRAREEKANLESQARAMNKRIPLVTVSSSPTLPFVERDAASRRLPPPPRLPSRSRDEQPPSLPSRPGETPPPQPPRPSRSVEDVPPAKPPRPSPSNTTEELPPAKPPRRPPPPSNGRSTPNGFTNGSPKAPASSKTIEPVIRELDDQDFDSVIMRGKPTFVKMYSPHCWNCQTMAPSWKQISEDFAFASDRLIIAQLDTFTHRIFNRRFGISKYPTILLFDGHNETPERYQDGGVPELDGMIEFLEEKTGITRADATNNGNPSVNMSSKPSLAEVNAVQSRPRPDPPASSGCLICRDFSRPDQVASEHPRESLPPGDKIAYLADVLCRPFRSPTDKARAIFRWLAYNIAYDTAAFFGNNVKHVDPRDTIETGLAVCGGYAGLYVAIGREAGLECEMVTGHGKGFGYSPLKPGDPVPPCKPDGHAWNAVRIDDREWKLLDACWGAGNVTGGSQVFNKSFTPSYFTMPNDEFGIKHFPQDKSHFFRSDGGIQTWKEYMMGPVGDEPLQLYGAIEGHGLSRTSFSPPQKRIAVNTRGDIRFQFSKACEHWDHERNGTGKPYCMVLHMNGADGKKKDFVPFDSDDFWWWLDVPARDLGTPGQTVSVYALTTINGKDGRGLTKREYLQRKGNCATGFGGVCAWDLV